MKHGYSLRLRLLIGAALATFAALALAWLAMLWIFSRHVERRVETDLRREATALIASVQASSDGGLRMDESPFDRRFQTPASGLYWQIGSAKTVLRSRSLWDQQLDHGGVVSSDRWSRRKAAGPFERYVLIVERRIVVGTAETSVLVQVAQTEHDLYLSRVEFGRELAASLAILWLVLGLAAWVQVGAGLRPLKRLRADILALKRRPDERVDASYPSEVAPLIEAINTLAEARDADVRRARQRAADMAHAMKTPIAALTAQTRGMNAGDPAAADGIQRAIASVSAAVEAELGRARAAASRQQGRIAVTYPANVCRRLVAVLERTDKGMRTDFVIDLSDDFTLRVEESDLTEILGALLENAARHTRHAVKIGGGPLGDGGRITIDDDGPGLEVDEIDRVLGRGVRLDQRGSGHGLGLSIARELADATEGSLTLSRAPAGGLRVELAWAD